MHALLRFVFFGVFLTTLGPVCAQNAPARVTILSDAIGKTLACSVPHDGYCWCEMCGFNAKVKLGDMQPDVAQIGCRDCESIGSRSFLSFAATLPEHVIPDEPMRFYRPSKARKGA